MIDAELLICEATKCKQDYFMRRVEAFATAEMNIMSQLEICTAPTKNTLFNHCKDTMSEIVTELARATSGEEIRFLTTIIDILYLWQGELLDDVLVKNLTGNTQKGAAL